MDFTRLYQPPAQRSCSAMRCRPGRTAHRTGRPWEGATSSETTARSRSTASSEATLSPCVTVGVHPPIPFHSIHPFPPEPHPLFRLGKPPPKAGRGRTQEEPRYASACSQPTPHARPQACQQLVGPTTPSCFGRKRECRWRAEKEKKLMQPSSQLKGACSQAAPSDWAG